MGIFSRITEIVNANINAMLDKAEDPQKMVKLMIHEMEDTLTEVKSAAAEVVADKLRLTRLLKNESERAKQWAAKAQLALEKGREDLAREALEQKVDAEKKMAHYHERLGEIEGLVAQYQGDITRLEEKLAGARARQQTLIASHRSAMNRRKVEDRIHRVNTSGAFARFEQYENRIDRWNAEADVMQHSNKTLDDKFSEMMHGNAVDDELAALKAKLAKGGKAKAKVEETAAAQ